MGGAQVAIAQAASAAEEPAEEFPLARLRSGRKHLGRMRSSCNISVIFSPYTENACENFTF